MRAVVTAIILSVGISTCAVAQSTDGGASTWQGVAGASGFVRVGSDGRPIRHAHRHDGARWTPYPMYQSLAPAPSTGMLNYDGYRVHDDGGFQPGDANGS